MPFKINHYPSRQKPDLIRTIYLPLTYYEPAKYKNNSSLFHKHKNEPDLNLIMKQYIEEVFQSLRKISYM